MGVGRSQLAGRAVTEHLIMQVFEWTIVASGLFTTVLISVKAFASPRSRDYLLIAVAAIGLSSFSTAVATLNSFYTPRTEYEKTEQSLASLRTLHRTLAAGNHAREARVRGQSRLDRLARQSHSRTGQRLHRHYERDGKTLRGERG